MKWRIADFFVIALVLVLAFGIWLYPFFSAVGNDAQIKQGEEIKTVSLLEDKELKIQGATVKIKDGSISITESDCPDKVCVNTGEISKQGESIVCVPNEIVITIGGEREVDVVVN